MLRRDLLKAAVAATLAPPYAMGQEASSAHQPSREKPQTATPARDNPLMRDPIRRQLRQHPGLVVHLERF